MSSISYFILRRTFCYYCSCIHLYVVFKMRNKETGLCLDSMGRKQGEKVGMVSCHGMGGNQVSVLPLLA